MSLSLGVVMPAYNEEATIGAALDRVFARADPAQVIVVDDGSRDRTLERIEASAHRARLTVLRHERNRGKGAAIRTAVPHLTTDAAIIQDADLEYDPADYARLLAVMERTGSPVVFGSRNLAPINPYSSPWFYWGGRAVTAAANLLFGTELTDEPTGYKLFRTELLQRLPLTCEGFEFCPEVTGLVARLGLEIHEVPVGYVPRSRAQGKKIRARDGLEALGTLWRTRLRPLESIVRGGEQAFEVADLLQMGEARAYTRWILERFAPWFGETVLEIGAGIGAYTMPLLLTGKRVVACEMSPACLEVLRERAGRGAEIVAGEFPGAQVDAALGNRRFDSVLCVNVLEHVDDPVALLRAAHARLAVGGRLLLLVPAVPAAFGPIDQRLQHRRRYGRAELAGHLADAGFTVEVLRYTNPVGLLGWMINARVTRRTTQSVGQILAFDRLVVPVQRLAERVAAPPVGQSLIAVART